jgi:hypothetical protein
MLSPRLLQLAGISLTSAVLTTQGMARSEAVSSPGPPHAHSGTAAAYADLRQRADTLAIPAGAKRLPLVIDGSKTPELISDSIAFGHFARATLAPTDSPDEALTRQRLMLAPLQLSDSDRETLLQTIQVVRENLDRIDAQRRVVSASSAEGRASIVRLSDEQAQLFEGARRHLDRTLTPAGSGRLNAHLRGEVKRRIKAYGDLPH